MRYPKMKSIILSIILFISFAAQSQTLPVIKGETIENKSLSFPSDLKGKYSLLCFASSQKAENDLQSWLDPVYQKYIAKTGIMDDMYDVNVYFVPVLTGTNLAFAASMKKKFRESAQEDLKPHVLFCDQDGKEIIEKLNMSRNEVPYFFLLDKDGKIVYRTNGPFTDEKLDAIDELIDQ
jgi:hypothetical protein